MKPLVWKNPLRISRDDRGTVTVEFIIWVPLLIFWLVGTVVFFDAFKTRSALISTNSTVADIISRNSEVDQDYIDLLQLMQVAMLPRISGSGVRISSIEYTIDPDIVDDPGVYSVNWSASAGDTPVDMIDETINIDKLPDMYSGEVVLMVESYAPFVPITAFLGLDLGAMISTAVISPRYGSRVVWVGI